MSFRGYMLLLAGFVFGGVLLGKATQNFVSQQDGEGKEKTPVDIRADKSYFDSKLNEQLGLEERAMILVGDVVFHHNGAVIVCDSAIRYSDRRIDCFKNVIINKDSTFVYGDRAEYNGDQNLARVYSPIVKVVDGTATLYTYNFTFNTLDNIGTWFGGGVLYQEDNTMESEKGYFYSDLHELVAVRAVQMKNDTHEVISDSVRYNTETKIAHFLTRTHIWTTEGEIIRADRGRYSTTDSTYFFWNDAYLLTDVRETWADTIDFNVRTEDALLLGNVQVDDNEHDSSAFGDWAQYWGARGETMLTRMPSILNYDADEGNADTLYIRADTIFMYVRYPSDGRVRDTLSAAGADSLPSARDSLATAGVRLDSLGNPVIDSLPFGADSLGGPAIRYDSLGNPISAAPAILYDSLGNPIKGLLDSMAVAAADSLSIAADTLTAKERKALKKAEKARLKEERRAAKDAAREAKRAAKAAAREAKIAARRRAAGEILVGDGVPSDSLAARLDSIARMDSMLLEDSLLAHGLLDSLAMIPPADTLETQSDTTMRIFRGWHNVRIWRTDMQGVADSMVGFSVDSTLHMYIDPVLWNNDNQIFSDSITLFTAGGQVEHAEFIGDPIMSSHVQGRQYNQVKSKTMTSWFRDGQMHRHDAVTNAEALYYLEEEGEPAPVAFLVISSDNMSFLFENDSLRYITPRETVEFTTYPMDQIPPTQPTILQGFRWFIDRRPSLQDVFTRRFRPSERVHHEAIPRPDFPIAARIDRRREYLIANRMWGDRTDPLPAHAVEFRNQRQR